MARGQQQGQGRQEGARWIDRRPSGEEVAEWYSKNVRVDELLDPAHYLAGITLIPAKEFGPEVDTNGKKVEHQTYTPYPKVETRTQYFWDWCDAHGYLGEIELQAAAASRHLPAGFFSMPVYDANGKAVPFVGVSYKVNIFAPSPRWGGKGRPVRIPPAGTKVVPLLRKSFNGILTPDENAVLKAQTGGIGRALGYAGMLIVPGSGIATAEDMQEYLGREPELQLPDPALPAAPAEAGAAPDLTELVAQHIERLQSEFPAAYEEAAAWAQEKGFDIAKPPWSSMRGLEKLLRGKLQAAERRARADANLGLEHSS